MRNRGERHHGAGLHQQRSFVQIQQVVGGVRQRSLLVTSQAPWLKDHVQGDSATRCPGKEFGTNPFKKKAAHGELRTNPLWLDLG